MVSFGRDGCCMYGWHACVTRKYIQVIYFENVGLEVVLKSSLLRRD